MNNLPKMLSISAAIFIFIFALNHGLQLVNGNTQLINLADQLIYGIDRDLVMRPEITEEEPISGYEVRHLLFQMQDLNADIQVDGELFDKSMLKEQIDVSSIPVTEQYDIRIVRDHYGEMQMIIFNRL